MREGRGLLLCWAVALFGALTLGFFGGHGEPLAVAGRMGSSVVLVIIAALSWRARDWRWDFSGWIFAGICCGALGDFFNAGLLIGRGFETLAAMLAFGAGHLFYIGGMSAELRGTSRSRLSILKPVIFWLGAGTLGWWLIVFGAIDSSLGGLVWPALGYTLLLSTTAGIGAALASADRNFLGLAAGAILFLLSDLILAVEIFRGGFEQATLAVWLPYGVGQMLIVRAAVGWTTRVRDAPRLTGQN